MDDPDRPEVRAFPGAKLRAPRGARLVNGLVATLVVVIVGALVTVPELRTALGIFAAIIAVPFALAMIQFRRNSPRGGGRIEVSEDGVYVEGRLALPREMLDRAVVVPGASGASVAIQRKRGFTSVIDVESAEQGRELVEALGLSAAHTLSSFTFDSLVAARLTRAGFTGYLLLLPALFALGGLAWVSVPLVLAWYAGLMAMSVPTKITVGLDGLLLRWLWRRELIHFTHLRDVDHDGRRVRLTLADGRVRVLSAAWMMGERLGRRSATTTGFASRGAYLDAVVTRVREAIAASRRPAERVPAAALLRQGRDVAAWMRALRALLSKGTSGFREAELVPEKLWSTVEDGGAEPAARAAAAVALGPALDDAERQRLVRVARVCVSPKLRIALEAAADGDDDHVAEALAELEQAQQERRTS